MIIVDRALEQREKDADPIRVGLVGAGFMGRGIALQILTATPGMELVAVSNRSLDPARVAFVAAGVDEPLVVDSVPRLEQAIHDGQPAITDEGLLLSEAEGIDAIVEVTGSVEFGAQVVLRAIEHGKHAILMNAELDGTLGPILKDRADGAGVIYTNSDGDQPGVMMNLYRFVKGIGVRPVLCGNIKGLHDRIATRRRRRASRARGSEAAYGDLLRGRDEDLVRAGDRRQRDRDAGGQARHARFRGRAGNPNRGRRPALRPRRARGGQRDRGLCRRRGAGSGVFVLGMHSHPTQQHYLNLYKLGEGPLYCFYTPYHLCHFEAPATIARAVDFGDAALAPAGCLQVEVVATAKVYLKPGDELDGFGGYLSYGLAENADIARSERLLPLGLTEEGCRLVRPVAKDEVLTYDDVELPGDRLCERLRVEQDAVVAGAST